MNLFEHDFKVCDSYRNGLEAAAKVACPAHLVLGSLDQMAAPQAAGELALALEAEVTRLACGHAMMQEAPEAVLQALRTALE